MSDMFEEGARDGRNGGELDGYTLFSRGDEYTCGFVWGYTDRMVGFALADVFWSLLGDNARKVRAPLNQLLDHVPSAHIQEVRQAYYGND